MGAQAGQVERQIYQRSARRIAQNEGDGRLADEARMA
jgi:hypothetical protein